MCGVIDPEGETAGSLITHLLLLLILLVCAHALCFRGDGREHGLRPQTQVSEQRFPLPLSGCHDKRLITTVTAHFTEDIALSTWNVAGLACVVTAGNDSNYVNVFVQIPYLKNFSCCVNWI
jgi:hypothetical protein